MTLRPSTAPPSPRSIGFRRWSSRCLPPSAVSAADAGDPLQPLWTTFLRFFFFVLFLERFSKVGKCEEALLVMIKDERESEGGGERKSEAGPGVYVCIYMYIIISHVYSK